MPQNPTLPAEPGTESGSSDARTTDTDIPDTGPTTSTTEPTTTARAKVVRYLIGLASVFTAVHVAGVHFGLWHTFIDLAVYRAGAHALLNDLPLYGNMTLIDGPVGLPFTYPPTAAIAFVPLALFGPALAQAAVFASTLICLGVVLWIVLDRLRPELDVLAKVAIISTLVFVFEFVEPVRTTMGFGQVNVVLMLAIVLDTLTRARYWPRGLLIGIAVAIKLTPAVFLLFFLLRKDWRAAATMVVSTVATIGLGWLLLGGDSKQYWLHTLWDTERIGAPWFANNQSFKGMLSRFAFAELWETGLWLALCGAALVLAAVWMRRLLSAGDTHGALLVNALLVLLVSPVSWTHHWVWAAPALVIAGHVLYTRQPRDPLRIGVFSVVALIFTIGPTWLLPRGDNRELDWSWWLHLLGNSYLIIGVAVLIVGVVYSGRNKRESKDSEQDSPAQDASAAPAS
ncbi:MAG: DUF2029 domain-containing protein [Rhodococcus sp.]|nr:DUF2029 domain-containing protein [Rhodococcus sp. (in: high G+C Gram-positive bacteria)]